MVAGATLCVSARDGAMRPDSWEGLYHRDVRVLSRFTLTVDGQAPALLAAEREGASRGHRVHMLATDPYGSPTVLLTCRRTLTVALEEEWRVEVYDGAPHTLELRLTVESDLADLLARKHDLVPTQAPPWRHLDGAMVIDGDRFGVEVDVRGPEPRREGDTLAWTVKAAPGRPWEAGVMVCPRHEGRQVTTAPWPSPLRVAPFRPPATSDTSPGGGDGDRRSRADGHAGAPRARAADAPRARADAPAEAGDRAQDETAGLRLSSPATHWARSTASALADLDGLRIHVPDLGLSYIGAGAPWFMALFGRDTLLTAWSALISGTGVGLDVLETLARFQGQGTDTQTLEQPGRILHEMRTGGSEVFGLEAGRPYYGSVDAPPLFVMLLAEVYRWGAPRDRVAALMPAARAALDWCLGDGDLDGDGFVEYAAHGDGLANQGWKDSGDALVHADGTLASSPIALAEVQAYVWGALQALAELEERLGDRDRAPGLRRRAAELREEFQRHFWLPERDLVAMALDGANHPLAVASSNMGHCLWTGLLEDGIGRTVAARMDEPDLRTAWGLRTLGAAEQAYNPLGYHLGAIWPHDTALCIAGLMRYGATDQAVELTQGLLTVAEHFEWRMPELFGGLDADQVPYPVPYPVACSPQAWSAAVPLLLLRTMLRLDPDVPAGVVRVAPVLPADVELDIRGIPIGEGTLDLHVHGTEVRVDRQPDGIEVRTEPPGLALPH